MPRHRTIRRNHRSYRTTMAYPSKLMPFTFSRYSIACERHPERNEDSIIVDERCGLAAVFDGVGGSAAGEIASQTAARTTRQSWQQALQQVQKRHSTRVRFLENCSNVDLCSLLQQLIQYVDEEVRTEGAKRAGTEDLATTIVLAAICRQPQTKGYTMAFAHVGDSRIYLLREREGLRRLTSDDGLLAKLVESQVINDADAMRIDQAMHLDQLSDTEFNYFRLRGGITQALGGPFPPVIHVDQATIYPGDRILLCTDGIHDNLTDGEIEEIVRREPRTIAARILIEHALERSRQERDTTVRAKPDDMSAIVMTCRF